MYFNNKLKPFLVFSLFFICSFTQLWSQIVAIDDVLVGSADNTSETTAISGRFYENDLFNGSYITQPTIADYIITETVPDPTGSVSFHPTIPGLINIAANTVAGIYYITYEICEAADTTNCDDAVIEVRVNEASAITAGAGSGQIEISSDSFNVNSSGGVAITNGGCVDLNTGMINPITLSAEYTDLGDTSSYRVEAIQFNPPFSLVDNSSASTNLTTDDNWSNVINFNFDFDFYGQTYQDCVISTNGAVSFDLTNANAFHYWTPGAGQTIPNNTDAALRDGNIFGAVHDIDPSVGPASAFSIWYKVEGVAPFRAFVFTFNNPAHFGCNTLRTTQQIVFYETTNIIETYIYQKPSCATWAGGRAAIGVQNNDGTIGTSPPGRNTGVWDVVMPEAWRFTPDGVSTTTFEWLDESGAVIGTGPDINLSPSETTTYIARLTYTNAITGATTSSIRPITINVPPTPVVTLTTNASSGCSGGDAVFIITGEEGDEVTYNINGDPSQVVTLDATGVETITISGITTDQTVTLESVTNVNSVCGGPFTQTETVTISSSPVVNLSSNTSTCSGGNAEFTITGTAGDVVDYTGVVGSPASPVTLDATGTALVTVSGVTTNQTITLTNVNNPTTGCSGTLTETETVTISVSPTVNLTSNTSTCSGGNAEFTITGTAGDVVDYTGVVGSPASPVTLDASGTVLITVAGATANQTITLTNVNNPTTGCSGALTETETVTINASPTVNLTSNTSTCSGGNAEFTITGTAGDVVDYTGVVGSPVSPVTLDASGTALVTVTGVTTNQTITLTSINNPSTGCGGTLSETETVTISANPTVSLTSNTSTCSGGNAEFTITGTAGDIVDYSGVVGSPASPVTLDASGIALVTVAGVTTDQTITLNSVSNPTTGCSGSLTETETVTINANPTVTLTSNTSICSGGDAEFTITGTAGDIVDYTGVVGSPASPVTLDASGVALITVSGVTTDQTITLVSVNNPSTGCSGALTDTENVIVNANPTVTLTSNNSTCSGGNAEFTITGAVGYVVDYAGVAGMPASPVTIGASGTVLISITGVTTDQTMTLTNVNNPSTGCNEVLTDSETVTISANPTVTLTSNTSTCSGGDAEFTIAGTAGDVVDYTGVVGSPASPITLGASGVALVTVAGVTTNQTITLTNVNNPTTGCGGALTDSETVTINANPTIVSLTSGNSSVCSGDDAEFTITGTAGDEVAYTGVSGSPASPVILDASGVATITVVGITTNQTITLTNVTNTTTTCSSSLTDSETVTIIAAPTIVSLTSNTSVCSGDDAEFTITGTAGDVVDYSGVVGSPASPVTLDASGEALVTVAGITTDQTMTLVAVTNTTTSCSSVLSNNETVSIITPPTVSLVSNGSVCYGEDAVFTITGTAGDIIDYNGVVGMPASPVTLDASGEVIITVTGAITDQTISLTNVNSPSTGCSGVLTDSETVTINANPTILSLTTNTDICSGSDAVFTITGTAGDVVDYVGVVGSPVSPITLDASGLGNVTVVGATTDQTIMLTNVANPTTTCSSALSDTATITVNTNPTIISLTSNTSVCSGDDAEFTITGTAGDVVSYSGVTGSPASPLTLDASGIALVTVTGVTVDQTISLSAVTNPATTCSSVLTDVETVTIIAPPTVGLSSNGNTCSGDDAIFTITGTAGDIIDYTGVVGIPASPVTLDAAGEAIVRVIGVTTDQTISLTNANSPSTGCSGTLSETATVIVNPNPSIISLSSNFIICSGEDAEFTITGTAGDVVDYSGVVGSPASPVTLNASGEALVIVSGATTNQTITLSNVTNPLTTCDTALTDTETVVVTPLEDARFSMTPNCSGGTASVLGTSGGVFIFDVDPADGSVIDSATGEVTNAIPGASYTILYTTPGACQDSQVVTFTVNPRPIVDLQDSFILCIDNDGNIVNNPIIDSGLSILDYSFEWTEASNPTTILGTNSFYEPTIAGTYSVFITNSSTGCVTVVGDPDTISVVTNSIPPTGLEAVIVSETFASDNVIQVSVDDISGANYEFSIDNGSFQSNGTNVYTFNNVTAGLHTLTVRDADGCGEDSTTIVVVDYPLFFTPNNDGHNDTWRISGINSDAVIYIFDRYGKLIKQLSPTSIGWDGTFNGQPLPSSDYWFSLEYKDPNDLEDTSVKEFRAHFTLKR
ncbi:T9SS type B sorting domain-containing protein [Oceanihabitans sp. 2_MG-2023]|uniref:T9SS type B sorting domain-containing protein n=1 Tax=Oceanihabitans sp. 2_MG-2023 TaxID=3062661 RepID=UPI0026E3140C|nr:T9SS type B sorting domain-containing protein [Oceanihabitans sp. 2_MG-2023]MDO6597560.1 T9SS type B sorting domain-containing protein [Oceanihabitans sp. 2_MG-2023]